MSYGPSLLDGHRLAGVYSGRILQGDKPRDWPVQQSTKVELVINLRTAKALGITIPLPLIGRADKPAFSLRRHIAGGPPMEEISKRAWQSAFAPPAPRASTAELTAADREALAHVTGLLRAYYQTLLIEPTPERLLGLIDEIDAAWKRRAAARS